jgi:catechol 2,3-dioxygenase-like lactoylglutathione lyase family enzyme
VRIKTEATRGLLAALILTGIVNAPTASLAADPAPVAAAPVVNRTNFLVADLDRSLQLYRDILGFKVNAMMPVRPESYMYDIFRVDRAAKLRLAFLAGGDGRFGSIGLTEVKGAARPAAAGAYPSVLILEIKGGIEALHGKVRAAGLEATHIYELTNPVRQEFILTDADGNRVLLMQVRAEPAQPQ